MLLEIKGVHSFYGSSHVLHGVSLDIGTSGIVSVLGRNGVGKTTLMRTITGVIVPNSGSVRFNGQDVTKLKTHDRARMGISYVPQGRELIPDITVAEKSAACAARQGERARTAASPATCSSSSRPSASFSTARPAR